MVSESHKKIIARLNYLRMAPRKVRLIADLIRFMTAKEALVQLQFLPKRAANPMLKLLHSAVRNAEHNFHSSSDRLYIKRIMVHGGPMLKRWMPRARGSASEIQKRMSHIEIELAVIVPQITPKRFSRMELGREKEEVVKELGKKEEVKEAKEGEKKEKEVFMRQKTERPRQTWGKFVPKIFRRKSV